MKKWQRAGLAVATSATLAISMAGVASASGQPSVGQSSAGKHDDGHGHSPYTFAVIGDIPYGDAQIARFPAVIQQIDADPDVRFVSHLGDIKSGSSLCSNEYFAMVKSDFDTFTDPLVYTPGDNEWTDCHRANNGSYNPLERLDTVRRVFFPQPGVTLGQSTFRVDSQAAQGYPENVEFTKSDVRFASLHIVGSNNSLVPWTGQSTPTPEQTAEVLGRTAATIQLIRDTFADARSHRDRAVALFTQADMFDPTVASPAYADYYAFTPIVKAIAEESAAFGKPVYLFNGDSHVYNDDAPLATGSKWLAFYGVRTAADNLTRVTVDGSTGANNWLKVSIDRGPAVLSWNRVPFA